MDNINSSQRETLTVGEVQEILGIGRNKAYEFVRTNKLAIAVGRRLVVPRVRLEKFLAGE